MSIPDHRRPARYFDPGREAGVVVPTDERALGGVLLGRVSLAQAVGRGDIRFEGPPALVRAFPALIVVGRDGIRTALGQPLGAVILLAPNFIAGLNPVAFRQPHEVVCRMEAERHRWLAAMVGGGYSARRLALTGIVLLVLGIALVVWIVNGSQ